MMLFSPFLVLHGWASLGREVCSSFVVLAALTGFVAFIGACCMNGGDCG
jgi:hypothetical protein